MASKIKVDTLETADGTGSIALSNQLSGMTVASLPTTGTLPALSGANLTALASANLTGALPAISGASLTNLPSSGLYASVAIIADEKAANTAGGTFTSGAWRTRDLNTEISDADGIVSIASNQFTLAAGTYTIEWSAPAYVVQQHQSALWNGSYLTYSDIKYNDANQDHNSLGWYVVTIGSSTAFEIRHKCKVTAATQGFGVGDQLAGLGNSTFTRVKILKHT
jgi:hypothetical protein